MKKIIKKQTETGREYLEVGALNGFVVEKMAGSDSEYQVRMGRRIFWCMKSFDVACALVEQHLRKCFDEVEFVDFEKIVIKKKVRIRRKVQQQPAVKVLLFVIATSVDWATLLDMVDIFV